MLEDPRLDTHELAAALRAAWGVDASSFTFMPGYDRRAASYVVATTDGQAFLKVRFGPASAAALAVPRALLDAGAPNVLAPMRTLTYGLWHAVGHSRTLVLYPFVEGRSAMLAGMTADQWRTFGATLRAVHDSAVWDQLAGQLPAETFALASAAAVRRVLEHARRPSIRSQAGERLRAFLEQQAGRIGAVIERTEDIGGALRGRRFASVLCHGDIHAANVLVAESGGILLVDWDGPMLAPPERDLFFVIGSRVARPVEPRRKRGSSRATVAFPWIPTRSSTTATSASSRTSVSSG